MPATVTLRQTAFVTPVVSSDTVVYLGSLTGITPGMRLFANAEMMTVDRLTGITTGVVVRRGTDGTVSKSHSTQEVVFVGRGDQFYDRDPAGVPPMVVPVLPWINIERRVIWTIQGDDDGPGVAARTWQLVLPYQERGALGVRVNKTGVGFAPADPNNGGLA